MKGAQFCRKLVCSLLCPQACALCGAWTLNPDLSPLCDSCRRTFEPFESRVCHFCGVPVPGDLLQVFTVCSRCVAQPNPYDYARAWGVYEGPLRRAIRRFKFDGFKRLAGPFAGLMAERLEESQLRLRFDWVLHVPAHSDRRRQRGYDQALLLAQRLARRLETPVFKRLRRIRHTAPQFGLDRRERRDNLRGAFALSSEHLLEGKSLLLVDDVMTTGATVSEVARTLRSRACPSRIVVLVLARPRLAQTE